MGVGFLVGSVAWAQTPLNERRFYPEELREDVETIRRAVHHLHPDAYRYLPKAALDQRFDSLGAALSVPTTTTEFMLMVGPVVQALGDAHTFVDLPVATAERLHQTTPLLPLKIRVIHGQAYIEEELMGFRSIPSGQRIRSIDGVPMERLLSELGALVRTDGHDEIFVTRTVERDFLHLHALQYGHRPQHIVEHEAKDGTVTSTVLRSLTGEEISSSYRPATARLRPWRLEPFGDEHAAWITCRTLDADTLRAYDIDATRMVELFLQEVRSKDLRTLVIDVRGAGGADLGMAEALFSMIGTSPYRVVREIAMRQPGSLPDGGSVDYASLDATSVPESDRAITIPADDPRLAMTPPYSKAFLGKVYVVCDGLTRDAGAAFVMLAKRSGRARIVGEEVGSNSQSFCGGREALVTLPRTKLRLHIPLARFVPEGHGDGPVDHGELPHHPVEQQVSGLAIGRDTVKASLLDLIRELQ
ncbi:MAG: hypothetical protein IPN85_02040 [Flavobacteriales bacterium]|nr:hypothetical protein [Flavobacteriales bacterium]